MHIFCNITSIDKIAGALISKGSYIEFTPKRMPLQVIGFDLMLTLKHRVSDSIFQRSPTAVFFAVEHPEIDQGLQFAQHNLLEVQTELIPDCCLSTRRYISRL